MNDQAKHTLARGKEFPYDFTYAEWELRKNSPPEDVDWALDAARGVLADLTDRRGIKQGFCGVDDDIKKEIVRDLADIIRLAQRGMRP